MFHFPSDGLSPYYSRKIGLSETGQIVPIHFAAKITSNQKNYNFGLMDVLIDSPEENEMFLSEESVKISKMDPPSGYSQLLEIPVPMKTATVWVRIINSSMASSWVTNHWEPRYGLLEPRTKPNRFGNKDFLWSRNHF